MTELLIVLLVAMIVARGIGELMERVGQLAILGELLAGLVLGALIIYGPFSQFHGLVENDVFEAITNLGMFFLMLMAGMEIDIHELVRASKAGLVVALGGIILPLGLGYVLGLIFLPDSDYKLIQSFLLGVVMSITAVPALTRVLIDLGKLDTRLGQTIMNAAIVDDILGIFLLAILTTMMAEGGVPSVGEFGLMIAKVVGFFVVVMLIGKFLIPRLGRMSRLSKYEEIEFSIALIMALAFGAGAELSGMHFIIGALLAGILIQEVTFGAKIAADLKNKVSGITMGFLAPVFFVSIGLHANLTALGTAPLFVLALLATAIVGKVLGCGLPARLMGFSTKESIAIGIGMNGRGAVEIVIAIVALKAGLFSQPVPTPPLVTAMFSSIVIMAIVTTLMVPIGMKPLIKGERS